MDSRYDPTLNAHLSLDGDKVRAIDHRHAMWQSPERAPRATAAAYLRAMAPTLAMPPASLDHLHQRVDYENPRKQDLEYRLSEEKSLFDSTTFAYWQTYANVPIWDAGVTVTVKQNPSRVVASVDHSHTDVDVALPPERKIKLYQRLIRAAGLNDRKFADLVDRPANEANRHLSAKVVKPRRQARGRRGPEAVLAAAGPVWKKGRFFLYKYDPAARFDPSAGKPSTPSDGPSTGIMGHTVYTLPLPAVPASIRPGKYYLVVEVIFAFPTPAGEPMNWRALIEVRTDAVLYLRALADHVNGLVFEHDPISVSGNNNNGPDKSNAILNPFRVDRALNNLDAPAGGTQHLSGAYGTLVDLEPKTVAPPTRPAGSDFDFNARTDAFSGVNAYFHNDRMFELLEDLGFPVASYLGGTSFPIDVDHRGKGTNANQGNVVNAHCIGDGDGIDHVCYALAHAGDTANPIGIAGDWRVHLHEVFGHGILYDHVGSANFGFSHSAGDSFAAILSDPYSIAPDRFLTFPWVNIGRRHDRTPAAGWGWAGAIALNPFNFALDSGGYNNEQILSTTLFRIYRSIGGDSTNQSRRIFASRMAAYLILRAVDEFTSGTNPASALPFCNAMMTVDLLNWTSEGIYGGAYNKVIRWAFEKQGLFQAPATPTPANTAGVPPDQDVYIDDGRAGEYDYQAVHWHTTAIWNRHNPGQSPNHQEPKLNKTNYAWVKIKNRGTQTATNITVRGFHTLPGAGLTWPGDFVEFSPLGGLPVASVGPNSSEEVVVGPFEWTPNINAYGHDCILMVVSNAADPANIDQFTVGESIPEWRLVPNDNNIAQRNVIPVPGGGGMGGMLDALAGRFFVVGNPFRAIARMELKVQMPPWLDRAGWQLQFADLRERAFTLKPGAKRVVTLQMQAGRDFTPADVRATADRDIVIEIHGDGILIGGMTYRVDPDLEKPENAGGGPAGGDLCRDIAEDLLRCLKVDTGPVKRVCVRKVSVDIDFDDC
jgi:hypothetical protein